MKKGIITLFFVSILTTFMVGCGNKALQDGTYTAEDLKYDAHGWKASVTITVSSGRISDAKFEYTAEDGTTKGGNTAYGEKMASAVGITPDEYIAQYTQKLVDTQDPDKIDAISGATTSHKDFKTLATAAIDAAKSGNTTTTEVELFK
ncbi:MAG: FMN-binding protein [Clostridium sp.]|nr:FMN-binding protein [Clostridium sp.]MDU7084285.1 FMN-binding protein [Clostridium sp.]